jgi:YD repeat-containing protein
MPQPIRTASVAAVFAALMGAGAMNCAWAATDSAAYSYDALGRLIAVTYANGTTTTYSYDGAGNRTQVTVTCGGGGC